MKRQLIIIAAIVLVCAIAAFLVTRKMVCPCKDDPLERMKDVSSLTRELRLDNGQRESIEALTASLTEELKACCLRHCAARVNLGAVLLEDSDDDLETDQILKEMCGAYMDSERAVLEYLRRLRALLDNEQRDKFDRMFKNIVCSTCPACRTNGSREMHTH